MKRYKCHKVVEAAVILEIDQQANTITTGAEDEAHTTIHDVPQAFWSRAVPAVGDYLIRYKPDGYLSWSPKAVFEDGYTEMGQYQKG